MFRYNIFIILVYSILSNFIIFSQEKVTLTFAGDLMAHDVNFRTEPLADIYSGVKDQLLSDDLSFINLEFPIDETRDQSSYPSFNVHPEYVKAAIDGGFDVFSMANNHTNDYGYNSVIKTVENMEEFRIHEQIIYSGIYGEEESTFKVETIQVKNLKIGFLSVSQFNNNFWNKEGAAKIYIADYNIKEDVDVLRSFIEEVSGDYDCFILSYHGGAEYKQEPSTTRKDFFIDLTEAGVDILWGHHPHVLQPWTQFSTENGDKLIMHSMGNFVSGQLAIVDPIVHDINFAATGFSSLFKVELDLVNGKLEILPPEINMIANIRNENNFFVVVNKEVALESPMSEDWKSFYTKMFPVAEERIRKY